MNDNPRPYKENILEEALRITSTDRNEAYGHPLDNFEQIADLLTGYFRRILLPGARIVADDIPWVNILQKASRDSNSRKRDNLTDTAGYARTGEMVQDERERRAAAAKEAPEWVCLLMDCVPHLDLRVAEHNDGSRLRARICEALEAEGFEGWNTDSRKSQAAIIAGHERGA